MKRTFWHYTGDIAIENGGTFYNFDNWRYDFVDFVRVVPCNDAGGPDNEFWVEVGSVNLHPDTRYKAALDCIGMTCEKYFKETRARRRHILFDALLAYGAYDIESSRRIRIGKEPDKYSLTPQWGNTKTDDILRGNTSLKRYVRRVMRDGF